MKPFQSSVSCVKVEVAVLGFPEFSELCESRGGRAGLFGVQELCESRGGRPGFSVLMSLTVSVDIKQH